MGTGGFLTRIYKLMDIKPENIYGCETELDTIKFAFSSVQLTTGKAVSNLQKCDSLCESKGLPNKKHHIIVTNPPFGTSMKYDSLKIKYEINFSESNVKFEDIYPIKTNNGACLFTQMCVHKLVQGGVCAIVLPDGELFGGNGNWSKEFRKWLCENVNIRTILKVPGGTFEHAGVKTNIIIFTKDGKTENIKFLQTTKECDIVKTIFNVSMEDLEKTEYNLDNERYEKSLENVYDVPMVDLGALCDFMPKSKRNAKYGKEKGLYPFFKSSLVTKSFVDIPDFNEESIIIGDGGTPNINYSLKFSTSDHCYIFRSNNTKLLNKYTYLYILFNLNLLDKYYKGSGMKNISKDSIKKFKIPLPSLKVQKEIVEELSQIETSIKSIENRIKELNIEKEQSRKYYKSSTIKELLRDVEEKSLGDLFSMLPTTKHYSSIGLKEGKYHFYVSSQECNLYLNNYEVEELSLIIGNGGNANVHIDKQFTPSKHVTVCQIKNDNVNIFYIYKYLKFNIHLLEKNFSGSGLKWINKQKINNIILPIPTPEIQEQCIKLYEEKEAKLQEYDDKIQKEKDYIEELKSLGKDIIANYCCSNKQIENNDINENNNIDVNNDTDENEVEVI